MKRKPVRFLLALYPLLALLCACAGAATSAEEYYAIGMAYFDVGKYTEAEQWLNRAARMDKTKTASEYNLGRIDYENKRFSSALRHFERVLARDPKNVIALTAVAYTHVRLGNLDLAEDLYAQVLTLLPESADNGYNYALILYAMEKYAEGEAVLARYPHALLEDNDAMLLGARLKKALHKPEAADLYERSLEAKSDPLVRSEYAAVLEEGGFYARALEEYRTTLTDLPDESATPSKPALRYAIARLLFIADSASDEGITELEAAITEGFKDTERLEALLDEPAISTAHKDEIRRLIADMNKAPSAETPPPEATEAPADEAEGEKPPEEGQE
ncbi:MAG: tetratricopeptide repeat protein [Treponema sp.]|jgi:tetratricopeptide (TPR) repeat protein|nr:tetratricopeptide repeat protein [Treponema sp.]